jgi:AbrB family looped-hinge helix DNA binding protein
MEAAITTKGQATIPKAIREHLRLKPGDRVKFFLHPDGTVVLLPNGQLRFCAGSSKPGGPP